MDVEGEDAAATLTILARQDHILRTGGAQLTTEGRTVELRELITAIEDDCRRTLLALQQAETHSRPEGDLLACLRHAYFNLQALTSLGRRALAVKPPVQEA